MRGRVESAQGDRKEEEESKSLKYGHWHQQKFCPQHFHTMLWEMKKKNNEEGGKASRPLKLYSIALLSKALENRGVT